MPRIAPLVLLSALLLVALTRSVLAQDGYSVPIQPKMALLIGNWDYDQDGKWTPLDKTKKDRLPDLRNPCNDIKLIEAKLILLGWDQNNVMAYCNLTKEKMLSAIDQFTQLYMSSSQPFAFIYYAGHGVQVDNTSYIFGVDTVASVDAVAERYKVFPMGNLFPGGVRIKQELMSALGDPGTGSIFLVLDACRDNPIEDELRKKHFASQIGGVRKSIPTPGVKQLFSTADGKVASDGIGSNSPFAMAFAHQMTLQPTVDYVIQYVVDQLYTESRFNPSPQIPDEDGTFHPPPPYACFSKCGG